MSGRAGLAADERLAAYDFGPGHQFPAGRLEAGLSLLRAARVVDDRDLLPFSPAGDADLALVHDRDYLDAVARYAAAPDAPAAELAPWGLTGDNRPFPGMDAAARLVVGATVTAVNAVAEGRFAHAFAPMGGLHHAQRRRAAGFCLLNDVAVAVARCTTARPWRVLVVDLDAHHGDGVQSAFYDDPRVCTVSLHETGRYLFPGSGEVRELGRPPGLGRNLNVPLEPGTDDDGFLTAFDAVVEPLAASFQPDLLVTQNGSDGHAWDPLADLLLTMDGYRALARRLHRVAHDHCQGRWVATGGGGYDIDRVLPRAWALLWSQMAGRSLPRRVPAAWREATPARRAAQPPATWSDPAGTGAGVPTGVAEANARTVRAVRRLALPLALRAAYPLAGRRPPSAGRPLPAWESRAERFEVQLGRPELFEWPQTTLVLRDRCPRSVVERLTVDPGIHAFVRVPEREQEVLARITEEPGGDVVVAHTPGGVVVGYVAIIDPEPGTRFHAVPGVYEVGAIEVARGWRRAGLGRRLLRFALEPDPFEDLIVVAFGLAWHWDLEEAGLPALAYRRVLLRVFAGAGFVELPTDEPEIAEDPANVFAARIGSRVPPEREAAFRARLVSR